MVEASIIIVHYSSDEIKSYVASSCLKRFWLFAKCFPSIEIIVINNGKKDEQFKQWCHIYHENPSNNFAYARNWGFDNSHGKYVCFVDNDIYPDYPFWGECKELLEKYPDKKLIATPIHTGCHVLSSKLNKGYLDGHLLNKRSGSNCLFMKRETFEDLGRFREDLPRHRVGIEFCNRQLGKSYLMIHTRVGLARDMGIREYHYD